MKLNNMKYLLIACVLLISIIGKAQSLSYQEWQNQSKENIRLLPEYGHVDKTIGQKEADEKFIKGALKENVTRRAASDHLVELGFKYMLRNDIKTAMYRFNQAWLLDSTNENSFWGFGAIYFSFNDYDNALKMYDRGLQLNGKSSKIITDKATIYMAMLNEKFDQQNLDKALSLFKSSYNIDLHNENTTYKISTLYLSLGNCELARKYYNECMADGGKPVTDEYKKALAETCK